MNLENETNELKELKLEVIQLKEKINLLIEKIDGVNKSCSRMDGHISFVETVYNSLKFSSYLTFFSKKETLPTIKHD